MASMATSGSAEIGRQTSGGGVAFAVRSSLLPIRRSETEPVGSEVLVVELAGLRPVMTVVIAYRPPDNDASLDKIINVIDRLCVSGRPILLLGDFNLPDIVWNGATNPAELLRGTDRAQIFCDTIAHHGLSQHVSEPTRGGRDSGLGLIQFTAL